VVHQTVRHATEAVRRSILQEHGPRVLPDCYTGKCTCNFLDSLRRRLPPFVFETAIYTRDDGIVDWRCCRTRNPEVDFEVSGTHIGLAFNASAYQIIGDRLAMAPARKLIAKRKACGKSPINGSKNGYAPAKNGQHHPKNGANGHRNGISGRPNKSN